MPAFGLSNGVAPHEDPHACGSVVKIHLRPRQAQCERCNADVVQAVSRLFYRLAPSECVGKVARQVKCCRADNETR